jgi:hypothetical protein
MSLFQEGGPHKIRRVNRDQISMSINLPPDADGRVARECPKPECSPGYFKVKCGTGLSGQTEAFCPYCRSAAAPNDFFTERQKKYALDIVQREAVIEIEKMLGNALGLGPTGHRSFGGGMLKMEMQFKPAYHPPVWRPSEEVLKRDVICPVCQLDHSVFGFAFWCPDCGKDIFMTHVRGEVAVIGKILGDVERRDKELGPRVAAHDLGNSLEDLVSIFEATLKIEIRRYRNRAGDTEAQIDEMMRKVGSRLQSVTNAREIVAAYCDGVSLFDTSDTTAADLIRTFEKRHPITHNLGVVDRKYLERVQGRETEGKDVEISKEEILRSAQVMVDLLERVHAGLAPRPPGDSPALMQ